MTPRRDVYPDEFKMPVEEDRGGNCARQCRDVPANRVVQADETSKWLPEEACAAHLSAISIACLYFQSNLQVNLPEIQNQRQKRLSA